MQIVIRLTEVELTTGSIIMEEPTVWARVWISVGSFLILRFSVTLFFKQEYRLRKMMKYGIN